MFKKRLAALFLALALVTAVLAGCTGGNSDTPATSTPPASSGEPGSSGADADTPTERQTVKLGIVTCFTSSAARSAEMQLEGLQVALDQIDASGFSEYYDFELLKGDDQYDAAEAVSVANKLIHQDGIKVAFGHLNSNITFAALPTYEEAKIPIFTPSYTMNITNSGFEYVYRCTPNDEIFAQTMVDYLVEKEGCEKIGIYHANNDQGESALESFGKALAGYDMEFTRTESFTESDTDFTGPLLNFRNDNIDCLIVYGGDLVNRATILEQQAQLFDYDIVRATDSGVSAGNFKDLVPTNLRDGLLYFGAWCNTMDDDMSTQFIEDFKALDAESITPGDISARFYDAMYVLATALNHMGPHDVEADDFTEKLNEAIRQVSHEGLQGHLEPDEKGDMLTKSYVIQYQGETEVVVN